ncbi:MAG: transglycosylase SLT domain-containing protein, partial [Longimicrobiaceae bacterium]
GDLAPIRDWTRAFQAEALAQAGDAAAERVEISSSASPPARKRVALARVAALVGAGDTAAAVQRAERETRALASTGARSAAAAVAVERARLLAAVGQFSEARVLFRSVAAGERVSPAVRAEAARGFEQAVGRRTAREELARADAFRAAEDAESAAEALAAALRSGLADKGSLHFRLGQFYFEAREYNRAREAFAEAERRLRGRALASEAALFAARSLFRDGHPRDGQAGLERVAREYPGTAAAGSAYFLLGDATNSVSRAIGYYRRAAGVPASSYAHEALYRLGDRLEREGNPGGAIQAWSDYARRYPRGEHASQAAYRAGVLQEGRGEGDAARDLYTAAIRADPVSYYALRAGYRTGEDPLAVPLGPSEPWVTLASDAEDAETVLERLALLEEIGAGAAWQEEYETALAAFDARPYALLELAAGLVEQEHVRLAIGLGWDLLDKREGKWDRRLLEVIFPFPWRSIFEREAGRYGVEATLLAGLVRQESLFQPAISSWVGASGLAQIMPGTGSWLAPKVGLDDYEHRLLTVPEVSLRIGAYFLGSLLGRYDGARDLALAGYNAGPGRADRWRRTLGYGQGTDRFRESIPFDETRDYVKKVLLNAAVYQRLYGDGRPSGLVED